MVNPVADPERRHEVRLPASHGGRRALAVAHRAAPRPTPTKPSRPARPTLGPSRRALQPGVHDSRGQHSRAPVADAHAATRRQPQRHRDADLEHRASPRPSRDSVTPPNIDHRRRRCSASRCPTPLLRTFPAGTTFTLTVTQRRHQHHHDLAERQRRRRGNNSRVEFNSDHGHQRRQRATYSAAFNGGAAQGTFYPGRDRVRARADQRSVRQLRHRRARASPSSIRRNVTQREQRADDARRARRRPAIPPSAASCIFQYSVHRAGVARARRLDGARHRRSKAPRARSPTSASAISPSRSRSPRSPSSRPRRCCRIR